MPASMFFFSWIFWCSELHLLIQARHIVDLTHTYDEKVPKYPLAAFNDKNLTRYATKNVYEGYYNGEIWLSMKNVEYFEHQGTHIDAPIHFGAGRQSLEEIPPERLIGPGVVIDVKAKAKANPDYAVTVQDITDHEEEHGRIPPGAIVTMNSGWGEKYPNPELVFGTTMVNDVSKFHFPGFSPEACEMLMKERQVGVVGVDTPTPDRGQQEGFPCHIMLQNNNIPILEYVANLDSVPVRNTTFVLGAIKRRHGTGGPTRIFALIEDENGGVNAGKSVKSAGEYLFVVAFILIIGYGF